MQMDYFMLQFNNSEVNKIADELNVKSMDKIYHY